MQHKIHLFGDSIFNGWALGTFEPDPAHPLYEFRSISSMANMILAENGIKDEFGRVGVGANLGSDIAATAAEIRAMVAAGDIRSGDVVVFEDAGPHCEDPDIYQAQWETLRAAAADRYDVLTLMMTMFDYPPAPTDSQYDRVIGTRSMNDATAAAATSAMNTVGLTLCPDMNAIMDYETTSGPYAAVPMMHPDGIHPNVWGQALMVGVLLDLCRYRPLLTTCTAAKALAAANYTALDYGSGIMTAALAEEMIDYLLRGTPAVVPVQDVVIDSYDISNQSGLASTYGGVQIVRGQAITLAQDTLISKVSFALQKIGAPTGTLYLKLYAVTGTVGVDAIPTGPVLAEASIDISTLPTTLEMVDMVFPTPYQANAGGIAFVLEYPGGNYENRPNIGLDNSSPGHPGNFISSDGVWAGSSAADIIFTLTGRPV